MLTLESRGPWRHRFAADPESRRGRTEQSRQQSARRARNCSHPGVAGRRPLLRRRAALHPRRRFRILQDAGGDLREVGRSRCCAGRHGARDSHLPSGRDLHPLSGQRPRRSRQSSGLGHSDARGVSRRRRSHTFPEQIREGLQPWQAKKLYMDNVRATEDWNVELETSQVDPLLGESYVQVRLEGTASISSRRAPAAGRSPKAVAPATTS